jgi:hypothetical protein
MLQSITFQKIVFSISRKVSGLLFNLRGVSESSQTVILVTALVKEDEMGGQSHISASHLYQVFHIPLCYEHTFFLYECFLNFMLFMSVMVCKIEQHICIKFCLKLGW